MNTDILALQASLLQAEDLPVDQVRQVMRGALADWSTVWEQILVAIDGLLRKKSKEATDAAAELTAQLCDAVMEKPGDGSAWLELTEELAGHDSDKRDVLLRWALERAEPGDAHVIAALFSKAPSATLKIKFGTWLLNLGTAELRSARQLTLGFDLLRLFAGEGDRARARAALEITLRNDRAWLPNPENAKWIVRTLALLRGEQVEDELLEAVLEKSGDSGARYLFEAFRGEARTWTWEQSVQRVLALGRLPERAQCWWWFKLIASGAPGDLKIAPQCFSPAIRALAHLSQGEDFDLRELEPPLPDGHLREWGRILAVSFAAHRPTGLPRTNLAMAIARRTDVLQGACDGFRLAMNDEPDADIAQGVRGILARSTGRGALEAVVHWLSNSQMRPVSGGAEYDFEAIARGLRRLLVTANSHRIGGFDLGESTRRLKHVMVEDLEDAKPVEWRDDALLVRKASLRSVLELPFRAEEHVALIELFVIHELVHLQQGMGAKSTVVNLRGHGMAGETTLMHLDLSADHFAACALAHTKYPGRLLWLKDLQGRSLKGFPVGPQHGYGSRYRKSLRLVGLRADLAARRKGLLGQSPHDGSYGFCDVGSAQALLLASGPPMQVLKAFELGDDDQSKLLDAASREDGLHDVDEILRVALAKEASGND